MIAGYVRHVNSELFIHHNESFVLVAELKGISVEKAEERTTDNAISLFAL